MDAQRAFHRRRFDLGWKTGFSLLELLVVLVVLGVAVAVFLPVTRNTRPTARRTQCRNNLKQIGLALHNYHENYGAFPPPYTVDRHGRPLHSWRTLILPFLDQQALYQQIDLSKPWDDPANVAVSKISLPAYQCPEAKCPANFTTYLAMTGSEACFPPGESRRIREISDGIANTLMVIEADSGHAVPWMAPSDADEALLQQFRPKTPLPHSGGLHAALVDGSVRFLSAEITPSIRHSLVTVDGHETICDDF